MRRNPGSELASEALSGMDIQRAAPAALSVVPGEVNQIDTTAGVR
jgi:hypothetical protein